jgi:hypothetical protein
MERIIYNPDSGINAMKTASFEKAAAEFEREKEKAEELSCNQLLKNLLITNLKLLKLNEISTMLLF